MPSRIVAHGSSEPPRSQLSRCAGWLLGRSTSCQGRSRSDRPPRRAARRSLIHRRPPPAALPHGSIRRCRLGSLLTRWSRRIGSRAGYLWGRGCRRYRRRPSGPSVDGRTFDEAAIVAEIEAAKARYPQAVVVRSDDYTSFRRPGFWVTLVAAPSSGPDGVNSWCDASGLGRDDCFAKRHTHLRGRRAYCASLTRAAPPAALNHHVPITPCCESARSGSHARSGGRSP